MQGSEGDFHCMGMMLLVSAKPPASRANAQYSMSPRAIIEHTGLLEIQAIAFEKRSMTFA